LQTESEGGQIEFRNVAKRFQLAEGRTFLIGYFLFKRMESDFADRI